MADNLSRAMAYLDRLPVAVSGAHGHNATMRAACECFRFGLTPAEALQAMQWFNDNRCQPKWKAHDLAHKVTDAQRIVNGAGQTGKHLGPAHSWKSRPAPVFVAPPKPAKRVTVKPVPVCQRSEAEEEAWWAAARKGMTLAEFDQACGLEVEATA